MGREEVDTILRSEKWPTDLVSKDSDGILVESPITFGATNWILVLDFLENKLVEVKVRTADSIQFRPAEPAPSDLP